MYIQREAETSVESIAKSFPSLLVAGPRQVGKSTLLRHLFPEAIVYNLDLAFTRQALEDTPSLLAPQEKPLLLDEIQKLPHILETLKSHIDANRQRNGLWWSRGMGHRASLPEAGKSGNLSLEGRFTKGRKPRFPSPIAKSLWLVPFSGPLTQIGGPANGTSQSSGRNFYNPNRIRELGSTNLQTNGCTI